MLVVVAVVVAGCVVVVDWAVICSLCWFLLFVWLVGCLFGWSFVGCLLVFVGFCWLLPL